MPIIAWDPATNEFRTEFVVADEQIDVYYDFGGGLWTPGHDPKDFERAWPRNWGKVKLEDYL